MQNIWWTGEKQATFENIEIPEHFGPFTEPMSDEKVKAYAFAQDDYRSWYFSEEDSPFGRRVAHPMALANDLLFLFYSTYDGNTAQGLHTHEELSFHSPVYVGEEVTIEGAYVDTYERRGKGYVVMEAEARGEDGRTLVRHTGTEIMRVQAGSVVGGKSSGSESSGRESPRISGEQREDLRPVLRASAGLEPGTPVAPLEKRITQEQMYVFSWGGRHFKNAHSDIEAARRSGLEETIVQAQQQASTISEMLTDFFGPSWMTGGWKSLKFIHPVYAGERITAKGAVTGLVDEGVTGLVDEGEEARLGLEVWVENSEGEMTAVGWASAAIDGEPGSGVS